MSLRPALFALMSAFALTSAAPAFAQEAKHVAHMAESQSVTVGDLEISGAFTRATLPNAPVAGGFLTIANGGGEQDRLISATSAIAKETQIHEMAMEGDVMKMRQLKDGLVIPAGETVTLAPGGNHIMFMGLLQPIAEGDSVAVTLSFERAGDVTLDLIAAGSAADAPAHGHKMGQ